jgi:hypothetical protein
MSNYNKTYQTALTSATVDPNPLRIGTNTFPRSDLAFPLSQALEISCNKILFLFPVFTVTRWNMVIQLVIEWLITFLALKIPYKFNISSIFDWQLMQNYFYSKITIL